MQNHQGRGSRGFHIAHRRSPSELTPLMIEQLALQHQMELLQVQQQQILAQQQQFAQAGLLSSQNIPSSPVMASVQNFVSSPSSTYAPFPMSGTGAAGGHRRTQSSVPGFQVMGPPQVPTSNSGSVYENVNASGLNRNPNRNSGSQGHTRRHSLALPEAKRAAQLAQQQKQGGSAQNGAGSVQSSSNFQFPPPKPINEGKSGSQPPRHNYSRSHGTSSDFAEEHSRSPQTSQSGFSFPQNYNESSLSHERRNVSNPTHSRSGSRNFDGDWRRNSMHFPPAQNTSQLETTTSGSQQFFPGHRSRSSLSSSMSSPSSHFASNTFGPGIIPLFSQQQFNSAQTSQSQQHASNIHSGSPQNRISPNQAIPQMPLVLPAQDFSQPSPMSFPMQQQQIAQLQSQQRKSLFLPYLTQASIPALLTEGRLVTGVLRVNKKNRSDAYVSTDGLLDADIYICGSKDRNRALEGDIVAVELLTVDEVWGSKREKEEKKKRKDGEDGQPGLQRRGSLRTRPIQKKNDDVEVEGQGLLLVEEDEISDDSKPLYAGHVVAVIERTPGQVYSGTLGLLRPSSQAAKEKQESDRRERSDGHESHRTDKPKIVWFKPTDKRVPLIAIPTEQAPRDFVENHEKYANTLFVASIKRWPITSLHPFGMLIESLGTVGDHNVEVNAILRDNSFMNDSFSDSVLNSLSGLSRISDDTIGRRSFESEDVYALFLDSARESDQAVHVKRLDSSTVQIGVHISDVSHYIKPNTPIDREAKARGTSVFMAKKIVPMLPEGLFENYISLDSNKQRCTFSVVLEVNLKSFDISNLWIGKSLVRPKSRLTNGDILSMVLNPEFNGDETDSVQILRNVALGFRKRRLNSATVDLPHLHLLNQLEDENVPVETNLFERRASSPVVDEIMIKVNSIVASILSQKLGERAFLRRHLAPNLHRLNAFLEKMRILGFDFDGSSSSKLQSSLFQIGDADTLKGLETLLLKAFSRAKYYIAGKVVEKSDQLHYLLNLPCYTTFTSPGRRYADILVHRQLDAVLNNREYTLDIESLTKLADHCNDRKDAAKRAQEQSIHLFLCEVITNLASSTGQLVRDAIVINVYESAFDVLIPEFGIEKRVHCDQLPLEKAEFDNATRLLELYWEKGVDSATFVPDDEKERSDYSGSQYRASSVTSAAAQDHEDIRQKMVEISSLSVEDESSLFDGDDESIQDILSAAQSKSLPPSPTKRSPSVNSDKPQRTASMTKINSLGDAATANPLDAYLGDVVTRVDGTQFIQEIRELQHVPVLLRAEIGKSLPCLTVRTLNPFAS
ncbi:uncharacterized protein V1513DRAFT_480069 [Lipomyces chichibuensis]|uniref:uncharacterized protein n=1 Tax=Lipomyces chichibuensis TaxID=1546026 RepID=UPI0033431F70